jgi:predicted 2-oxoglutarate/Fe(II)-dependent dioxygenase YbiX
MKMNLESYFQRIPFFSNDVSKMIIEELDSYNSWREYPYDSPKDNICVTETPPVSYYDCRLPSTHTVSKLIQEKVKEVTDNYIQVFLKDCPWFSYWTGNSQAHYIKYPPGAGMDTHCDHVRNQFDGTKRGIPILTLLVVLNDDYKGGEIIVWDDNSITPNAGEAMIFPSNFLYPHKVNEVLEGTRYSFVVWVW